MSVLNIDSSLVLVIDIQDKLLNAVFNREEVLKNSKIVTESAKSLDIPILVTEQYPKGLGSSVDNTLNESAQIFEKTSFSALDVSEILNALENSQKKQVIVMGIETHICVNQTVQALINQGYEVFIVKNASGSRVESEHSAGLDRMKNIGAQLVTAEIVIFEWLKTAKHPKFKEIQALIK